MSRYLFHTPLQELTAEHYDVVIAGGGLAGLYTALQLDERLKVAVIAKAELKRCNTTLAQGGIAAAVGKDDSPELHLRDTLRAGARMGNVEAARLLAEMGPAEIKRLDQMGVPFDTDAHGHWLTTCEGAHRSRRILHCGGDATGRLIMERLITLVGQKKNITVFENHSLTAIITDEHRQCAGVVAFHNGFRYFSAPRVVIAKGGAGGVYRYTTNDPVVTGDGIAAALRAGAMMSDMEYVQFHPTALFHPANEKSVFLISEAVRGEGAVLRNCHGKAFMEGRHRLKDLAPRDIVAREIFREMADTRQEHVFLDITSRGAEFLQKRFPTIYGYCQQKGLHMERDMIPVVPAQHYLMGGIKTDLEGKTTLAGLYACGEAACTGVHGANRLASNSLLECVVFGTRVAQSIHATSAASLGELRNETVAMKGFIGHTEQLTAELRNLMQKNGGIVRDPQSLVYAVERVGAMKESLQQQQLTGIAQFELLNMATVGHEILMAALASRDSAGAHYLDEEVEDYLITDW
ncbi:MAG: L-aspartate oxidase [Bacteroidota bacterium]